MAGRGAAARRLRRGSSVVAARAGRVAPGGVARRCVAPAVRGVAPRLVAGVGARAARARTGALVAAGIARRVAALVAVGAAGVRAARRRAGTAGVRAAGRSWAAARTARSAARARVGTPLAARIAALVVLRTRSVPARRAALVARRRVRRVAPAVGRLSMRAAVVARRPRPLGAGGCEARVALRFGARLRLRMRIAPRVVPPAAMIRAVALVAARALRALLHRPLRAGRTLVAPRAIGPLRATALAARAGAGLVVARAGGAGLRLGQRPLHDAAAAQRRAARHGRAGRPAGFAGFFNLSVAIGWVLVGGRGLDHAGRRGPTDGGRTGRAARRGSAPGRAHGVVVRAALDQHEALGRGRACSYSARPSVGRDQPVVAAVHHQHRRLHPRDAARRRRSAA